MNLITEEKNENCNSDTGTLCKVCLYEISSDNNIVCQNESERTILKILEPMTHFKTCPDCRASTHTLCSSYENALQNDCTECLKKKQFDSPTCIVCGSKEGEINVYNSESNEFHGHFICLYNSNRFLLLEKEFVPLHSSLLQPESHETLKQSNCRICSKSIHGLDNRFTCECDTEFHIFCVLAQRRDAINQNEYSDDKSKNYPLFTLREAKIVNASVSLNRQLMPCISEFVSRSFADEAPKVTLRPEDELRVSVLKFQIKCLNCKREDENSLFCCWEWNSPNNLICCSVCLTWVHQDLEKCKSYFKNDVRFFKEMSGKIQEKLKKTRNKNRNLKSKKLDEENQSNWFFGCKYCVNAAIQISNWKSGIKRKSEDDKRHDCFVPNLLVRNTILDLRFKSPSELLTVIGRFGSSFVLRLEPFQLLFESSCNEVPSQIEGESDSVSSKIVAFFSKDLLKGELKTDKVDDMIRLVDNWCESRKTKNDNSDFDSLLTSAKIGTEYLKQISGFVKDESFKITMKSLQKILTEILKKENNLFSSQMSNFNLRMISNPVKKIIENLASKISSHKPKHDIMSILKAKQSISENEVVQFLENKLCVSVHKEMENEFRNNEFVQSYLTKQFRQRESESFAKFGDFKSPVQFREALEKLLSCVFYDSKWNQTVVKFLNRKSVCNTLNMQNEKIQEKINTLKSIKSSSEFMKNYYRNFQYLISLKSIEKIIDLAVSNNFDFLQIQTIYEKSVKKNKELQNKIKVMNYKSIEFDLKEKTSEILDLIINEGIFVSENVFEFLMSFWNHLKLKMLANLTHPITLSEFRHVLDGVKDFNNLNHYHLAKFLKEGEVRTSFDNKINELIKGQLNVENFDKICSEIEKIKPSLSELKHQNQLVEKIEVDKSFWTLLTNSLSDSIDCEVEVELNVENYENVKEKISHCNGMPLIQKLYDQMKSDFLLEEFNQLGNSIMKKYWLNQFKNMLNSNLQVKMSLMIKLKSLSPRESKIVEGILENLNYEERNKIEDIRLKFESIKNRIEEYFDKLDSEVDSKDHPKLKIQLLQKLLRDFSQFAIDDVEGEKCYNRVFMEIFKTEIVIVVMTFNQKLCTKIDDFEKLCTKTSPEKISHGNKIKNSSFSSSKDHCTSVLRDDWKNDQICQFLQNSDFCDDLEENPMKSQVVISKSGSAKRLSINETKRHFSNDFSESRRTRNPIEISVHEDNDPDDYKRKLSMIKKLIFSKEDLMLDLSDKHKTTFKEFKQNFSKFEKTLNSLNSIIELENSSVATKDQPKKDQSKIKEEFLNFKSSSILFKTKLIRICDMLKQFEGIESVLLMSLEDIFENQIKIIKQTSKMKNLMHVTEKIRNMRIYSSRSELLIEVSDSLKNLFHFSEKNSEILKSLICEFLTKFRTDKSLFKNQKFPNEIEEFQNKILVIEGELKSIQKNIVSEENFKSSIEKIIDFVIETKIQTSFNYEVYSEFLSEVESIKLLVESNNNEKYIQFLKKSKNQLIQLPDSLKKSISDLRKKAAQINDFVSAEFSTLSLKEKIMLYKYLNENEFSLKNFFNEKTFSFFEEFSNKRKEFEYFKHEFNQTIATATASNQSSNFFNFERSVFGDLLQRPKSDSLISEFEKIEFIITKNHFLVVNLSRFKESIGNIFEILEYDFLIKLFECKMNKYQKRGKSQNILKIIKMQTEQLVFVHCQIILLSSSDSLEVLKTNRHMTDIYENLFKGFTDNQKEIREDLERSQKRPLNNVEDKLFKQLCQNSLLDDNEDICFENQSNLTGSLLSKIEDNLLREIKGDIHHSTKDKMANFQKRIFQFGIEKPKENNSLHKELYNEFLKNSFLSQEANCRKQLESLSLSLCEWIEEENRPFNKGPFYSNHVNPNNLDSDNASNDGFLGKRPQIDKPGNFLNEYSHSGNNKRLLGLKPLGNNSFNRFEAVKKFMTQLNKKPNLSKKFEEANYDFNYVVDSICQNETEAKNGKKMMNLNENSKQSQHSFSKNDHENLLKSFPNEEESRILRSEYSHSQSMKKVKTEIQEFDNSVEGMQGIKILTWQIKFMELHFKNTKLDLDFMTSMDPLSFKSLRKFQLYLKTVSLENLTISTLQTHQSSKRIVGIDICIPLISSVIESIKKNTESRETLFGGWFVMNYSAQENNVNPQTVKENSVEMAFYQMLSSFREAKCFVEETGTIANHLRKVYFGCARHLNSTIEKWLKIVVKEEDCPVNIDNVFVFFVYNERRHIVEGETRTSEALNDLVFPVMRMDEEKDPKFMKFIGWNYDDAIVQEMCKNQREILMSKL